MSSMANMSSTWVAKAAVAADHNVCATVIVEALNAKHLYVFAELLEVPSVQQLASANPPLHDLLKIFAYGVLRDYRGIG